MLFLIFLIPVLALICYEFWHRFRFHFGSLLVLFSMFFRDRFWDDFSMAFFTDFGPKRLQNGPRESPPWIRRRAYGNRPPPPNGPFGAEGVPKTFFIRFVIVFGPHFEMILGTFLKKKKHY